MINRLTLTGSWGLKLPVSLLALYACLVFPSVHLGFREIPWLPQATYFAFLAISLSALIFTGKTALYPLGFDPRHLAQNCLLGGLSGGLILASLPLLDAFIDFSGMGQAEIFQGAENRLSIATTKTLTSLSVLGGLLLVPILEQGFFNGLLLQPLIKKIKPVAAIYLAGLVFTVAHFDFHLSTFFIGLTTAGFFYWTGTLYASIAFQIICHVTGTLVLQYYPRVVTLLSFLF